MARSPLGIREDHKRINSDIDRTTDAPNMTPQQALEFLEELASDVEARAEAIREDLRRSTAE